MVSIINTKKCDGVSIGKVMRQNCFHLDTAVFPLFSLVKRIRNILRHHELGQVCVLWVGLQQVDMNLTIFQAGSLQELLVGSSASGSAHPQRCFDVCQLSGCLQVPYDLDIRAVYHCLGAVFRNSRGISLHYLS